MWRTRATDPQGRFLRGTHGFRNFERAGFLTEHRSDPAALRTQSTSTAHRSIANNPPRASPLRIASLRLPKFRPLSVQMRVICANASRTLSRNGTLASYLFAGYIRGPGKRFPDQSLRLARRWACSSDSPKFCIRQNLNRMRMRMPVHGRLVSDDGQRYVTGTTHRLVLKETLPNGISNCRG
jgi:hypothetical protein